MPWGHPERQIGKTDSTRFLDLGTNPIHCERAPGNWYSRSIRSTPLTLQGRADKIMELNSPLLCSLTLTSSEAKPMQGIVKQPWHSSPLIHSLKLSSQEILTVIFAQILKCMQIQNKVRKNVYEKYQGNSEKQNKPLSYKNNVFPRVSIS